LCFLNYLASLQRNTRKQEIALVARAFLNGERQVLLEKGSFLSGFYKKNGFA
jgi:hypothetical protein